MGNDIPGAKKAIVGLTQIKGIGYNFATAILDTLKINTNTNIGFLSESNVQSIEKLITNPIAGNFPVWFINRRKDIETGANRHLLTSDIPFTLRNDIERERTTNSWRGYRHMFGLKVRGQCTRTTGRKGGAVGVAKAGKPAPAQAAAAAAAAPAAPTAAATKSTEEKKTAPVEKKK